MISNHDFVQWYADRTPGELPEITLSSAPLWIYKGILLIWALWLAVSIVHWLRWSFAAFRRKGRTSRLPGSPPRRSLRAEPTPPSDERAERERARVS